MSDAAARDLLARLRSAWSVETGGKWRADNPARGQCSVTALVVQDALGGDIMKTAIGGEWHFYNRIDGRRCDLTDSQFATPIAYDDRPSSRDEALADTAPEKYALLRSRVLGDGCCARADGFVAGLFVAVKIC